MWLLTISVFPLDLPILTMDDDLSPWSASGEISGGSLRFDLCLINAAGSLPTLGFHLLRATMCVGHHVVDLSLGHPVPPRK